LFCLGYRRAPEITDAKDDCFLKMAARISFGHGQELIMVGSPLTIINSQHGFDEFPVELQK